MLFRFIRAAETSRPAPPVLPGGELFQGFFFGRPKLGGGGILVLLLRNEGKFWYKAPCCCILVDGCAVRDMWKPLVAEKIFIQLDLCDKKWILERKLAGRVATVLGREMLKIGGPGFKPTVVGFMTHTQSQRQVFGNGAGGWGG